MTTEQGSEPQGEPTAKPQGDAAPTTPPKGEQPKPQGGATGDDHDWKAEARKWEKAAKKDATEKAKAETQLQAIKDLAAGKDAEASEAEQRAARAELEATKYRIAYEAGLPPDLAVRLAGSTEEELKTDAEALAKYAGKKPKSDARADDNGASAPNTDKNAMLRQIVTGR